MSRIINQNTEPLFIFDMPDDHLLSETISVKGEKGERGDPTKLSDLENDEGFITADTDELANYYTKTATDNLLNTKLDKSTFNALEMPSDFFTASDTVTGSGSSITLANTAEAKFKGLIIYGDSQQDGTATPSNPITIESVTGEQTVSIVGDGTQEYTVDLGEIVLRKIGENRDYIYNSDGKWYKHTEIGKATIASPSWNALNGTSASPSNTSSNGAFCLFWSQNGLSALSGELMSSHMLWQAQTVSGNAGANSMADKTFVQRSGTNDRLYFRDTSLVGKTGYELDEMTENLEFYYILAEPTEAEITDPMLVASLNDLFNAGTYNGSTAISVTGSLAAYLSVEAYKNGWSGTISGINHALSDTFTKSEANSIFYDKVKYIFPKFWPNAWSGDANLIKYGDKNILIDCYNGTLDNQYQYVKTMLDDNDAKHIDVFICTHYHGDHINSLPQLVTDGYIDSTTKLFMPAETTQFWGDMIATWRSYCTNHDLAYYVPAEGETYAIGNLKFTFMNCDGEALDDYYPSGTGSQNATSTVILVEHKNTTALFTGDAEKATYERLQGLNFPNKPVDLHKMGHHGISPRTNPEYIRKLSPKFAVQTSGIKDAVKNNYGICEETAVLRAAGAKIYPTFMQTDYLVFESDGSAISCSRGVPYGTSDQRIALTYYVDKNASTSDMQDGSESYPFSEIMQAIASIPFRSDIDVTINVADGYYGHAHESAATSEKNRVYISTGKDVRITIIGNTSDKSAVVINGINAVSSNVKLKSLTLDIDNRTGITAYSSYISLADVVIKSNTDTATTHAGISAYEGSIILATADGDGIRIDQCANAIELRSASTFRADHPVEIGTITGYPINRWAGCSVYTGNYFEFDNTADKYAFKARQETVSTPLQIMASHDSFAQTVTLVNSASEYDWIEIFYRTNDNIYGSTGKIYSPNSKSASALVPFRASDGTLYNKQCRFNISGTTVTITGSLQVHVTSGSAPTIQENATYFNIEKVIAGFKDYIDIAN